MIVPTCSGQTRQDSMSHQSISKSLKCFEEVKELRIINHAKDTQIMVHNKTIAYYRMIADTAQKDMNLKDISIQILEKRINKSQLYNRVLIVVIAIETIRLIFK